MQTSTYATLFDKYKDETFLQKLEDYSLWTIPSVFPEQTSHGKTGNMEIQQDYQSIGAELVNNLAPKLASLLFPFKQAFFNISPTPALQQAIGNTGGSDWKNTIVDLEMRSSARVFVGGGYAKVLDALERCIITGNALFIRRDGKSVVYGLRNYSMLRYNTGELLDMVIKESKAWGTLPDDVKSAADAPHKKDTDCVDLYTRVQLVVKTVKGVQVRTFEVTQEVLGKPVPGFKESYPVLQCPYIPLVWRLRAGDSYGRGLVEAMAGDFAKLSDISEALAKYELQALRLVNLVKPGATTDVDALADAITGETVQGDPKDIGAFEGGEFNKIQQILGDLSIVYDRLSRAFMYRGNTRQGERVTAAEVEINAAEADQALGGAVSTLSAYWHESLAYILLGEVEPGMLAAITANEFALDITAGVPALGRSADVQNLLQAVQVAAAVIPALNQLSQRPDPEKILDAIMRSYNVNTQDIYRTPEELQALQEANNNTMANADPLNAVTAIGEVQ